MEVYVFKRIRAVRKGAAHISQFVRQCNSNSYYLLNVCYVPGATVAPSHMQLEVYLVGRTVGPYFTALHLRETSLVTPRNVTPKYRKDVVSRDCAGCLWRHC